MSSPYATGGGGTVLEHRFGALLLAHLLTGDPIQELGDDVAVTMVRFQADDVSPVDDLVVDGRTPDGAPRRVSISVRRAPRLTERDAGSRRLLVPFLRVVGEHAEDVLAGRWRLGVAVAGPNPAVRQLSQLATIARSTPDEHTFRSAVARPGAVSARVRKRLMELDGLVAAAAADAGLEGAGPEDAALTWRVLSALRLRELRLEGVDESDRTHAIGRLRTIGGEGDADALFARLAELAHGYAAAGAVVTEPLLRRDAGRRLARSPSHERAWTMLDTLATRARDRTRFDVRDEHTRLELPRAQAREALAEALSGAGGDTAALLVVGDPDVGKSALTLRAAQQLAQRDGSVTCLNLRDLPRVTAEFESQLGAGLSAVLVAGALGPAPLLVVDGAEAALEDHGAALFDLATAGLRAGLGIAGVTRVDAAPVVAEILRDACQAADVTHPLRRHEVRALSRGEAEQLAAGFGPLRRLADDPRGTWLLGRPGLVELLLRSGGAASSVDHPLTESDVFAVIWRRLVRNDERSPTGGATPDARERALTALARALLIGREVGGAPDAGALPSLRSDGLLLAPDANAAWSQGDEFAGDLIRDLSITRLLITDGFALLSACAAPRWTLRAARLACEAALAARPDRQQAWRELILSFEAIAHDHGLRWSEVPLEAALGARSIGLLQVVWRTLETSGGDGIRTLLRLAAERHVANGVGDPAALGNLVDVSFCGTGLGEPRPTRGEAVEALIDALVLAWLRGLGASGPAAPPLRRRVRDRILDEAQDAPPAFVASALAMLGPDLDARAEQLLRRVARVHPQALESVVESEPEQRLLAQHRPDLLFALTDAYYPVSRADAAEASSYFPVVLRSGLRGGQRAWSPAERSREPFSRLLAADPQRGIAIVNRVLDHAARFAVDRLLDYVDRPLAPHDPLPGVWLDLPGMGVRYCVGDADVWSWPRHRTGPAACVSALLAVQRHAVDLLDAQHLDPEHVAALLLCDAHNLAMPALVFGLVADRLERSGALIDRWLAQPALWLFESLSTEDAARGRGGDDGPAVSAPADSEHRFTGAAAAILSHAAAGDDQRRGDQLAACGDELGARAGRVVARVSRPEVIDLTAHVQQWADVLRGKCEPVEPGRPAPAIRRAWGPSAAANRAPWPPPELERLERMYVGNAHAALIETLPADVATMRDLQPRGRAARTHARCVAAAIAAAVVAARADAGRPVSDDDLRWAADALVTSVLAAEHERDRPRSASAVTALAGFYRGGLGHGGLDVALEHAAASLPLLLLPVVDEAVPDRRAIVRALGIAATSRRSVITTALSFALARVMATPCAQPPQMPQCRHALAWGAVETLLADRRLGAWARPGSLPAQHHASYRLAQERHRLDRLAPALLVASRAARGRICLSDQAAALCGGLLDAHRHAVGYVARYDHSHADPPPAGVIARVLVERAVAGDQRALAAHIRASAGDRAALTTLLQELATLFTDDETLRSGLDAVWPTVLSVGLESLRDTDNRQGTRGDRERAFAALLPVPQTATSRDAARGALARARRAWLAPHAIEDLVGPWLIAGRNNPLVLHTLIAYARCHSLAWQATSGLAWAQTLITSASSRLTRETRELTAWLSELRLTAADDAGARVRWHQIVDGLAAAGCHDALALQRADER